MKTTVQLQLMAAGEITQYIPPDTIAAIQAKDAHPLFRAYVVGEEGDATPNIIGMGGRVLNWLRASISAMVSRLQFGTKIFHNHAATNVHSGRTVVGEVVGKALEYIGGKMRAVAVAYIYPQFKDIIADAVSIEAEVDLDPTGQSNVVDGIHVGEITGIAVGDRRYNKPAFASAGLIAQLQAFEVQGNEQGGNKMSDSSLEQIRDLIMIRRWTPSELFSDELIKKDSVVRGVLKTEFDVRDRLQKEFDLLKIEASGKVTSLEQKNKELTQTIMTGKAQSLSQAIITERKMPEPKARFVTLKMPEFKIEGDALDDVAVKVQLNKFIDAKLDELGKYEAIFNPAPAGGNNGKGQGAQADQSASLIVEQ